MGSDPVKVAVARNLKKDSGLTENDVTLGLEKTKESIDNFIESVYPENCTDNVKNQIKKKLNMILFSKGKTNAKTEGNIQSIATNIGGNYTFFMFCFDSNKDGTINIAYKLITGELEIEKAYNYELKGNNKMNERVENLSPEETKKIVYDYLGLKEDEKLYELLNEEKSRLLSDK